MEYYETAKGKVIAIIDMQEFRKYYPKTFIRPLSYDEYMNRWKKDQFEEDED